MIIEIEVHLLESIVVLPKEDEMLRYVGIHNELGRQA